MNTDIELSLTVEEINTILSILGHAPTSSGVYPLMLKIKTQADACYAAKKKGAE